MDLSMLVVNFDMSLNQLLEKGIAVFFAVVLLWFGLRRMTRVEDALNSQTSMMHACFMYLGELIRRDKNIDPPSTPGIQGMARDLPVPPPLPADIPIAVSVPALVSGRPVPPPAPDTKGSYK